MKPFSRSNRRPCNTPHALFLLLSTLLAGLGFIPTSFADVTLVAPGTAWKYLDNGTDQGTAWLAPAFDDGNWTAGAAELGYGDADEATVVSYGPSATSKYPTTYFRHSFNLVDPAGFNSLRLRLLRDDGAVVYLNGMEVRRDNMPSGTISYATLATSALGVPQEATFYETTIAPDSLVTGTNVIAVEVHQANGTSSDLSFDLELLGVDTQSITRGPYLQLGTPTSIVVRWRTNIAMNSRVGFGTNPADLNLAVEDAAATMEHEVRLTGLTPNTQYYYEVGSTTQVLASGSDFSFFTPPPIGTAQPTRIWVLGDSGTANASAAAVRDGYTSFAGTRNTDVWLMLGDNAYENGTDAEFQAAVFNMYPSYLRGTPLWSAIGNHETAQLTDPSPTIPYFAAHTFPTTGEAGGVPSGTEKYYSFDYGRTHFIALDSMTSSRAAGGPMLVWLENDLAATSQDWIIAFWHHPPYTKGSHNSDSETQLIEMRTNVLPLLEAGGVDLVLAGHSHSYERSYLLNGHYGSSTTLTSAMKLDAGSGREDGTGAYQKPAGVPGNQGAVYAVAGSSGKISSWWGGSTADTNPTPHPAMFISLRRLGSMVIDVDGSRMDVKFLRETGAVDDYFTLLKTVPNTPPTASITSPAEGAVFTAPASISISTAVADTDGSVTQVDFYAGQTWIGTSTVAPFGISWSDVAVGTYALTAAATDNLGATTTSAAVNITVNPPPPTSPPPAPAGLTATAGNAQVALAWGASSEATSYSVKRGTVNGGPYTQIATTGPTDSNYTDLTVTNGTTYFYVVTASNAAGESGSSNQATATPTAPLTIPAAPTNLVATVVSRTQINLTWTDNAANESGYLIERSTNGSTFTQLIPTAPAGATTFASTGLSANKRYYYRVRATNAAGQSAYSNTASAKTPK